MQSSSIQTNRGFLFGDAVFETVKVLDGKVLFLEDHYFRLMSSMRILRMEIPMDFTLEFFEKEILDYVRSEDLIHSSRVRITVYRQDGGLYTPVANDVNYLLSVSKLDDALYNIVQSDYEVDLYKDFIISKQLLSSIKTTNRVLNVLGSIYAQENGLANCLLLNNDKNVVEALNGNIFMLKDGVLSTPPVSDGCINGIMRKQILDTAKSIKNISVEEKSISPFDLQKADELFITNVIKGIQPVTRYRKKVFRTDISEQLTQKMNIKIRLN